MRRGFLSMLVCCFANLSVWCGMFLVIDVKMKKTAVTSVCDAIKPF